MIVSCRFPSDISSTSFCARINVRFENDLNPSGRVRSLLRKRPVGIALVELNDDQTWYESNMSRRTWSSWRFADFGAEERMAGDAVLRHRGQVHRGRVLLRSTRLITMLGPNFGGFSRNNFGKFEFKMLQTSAKGA